MPIVLSFLARTPLVIATVLMCLLSQSLLQAQQNQRPPNIVVILADDMGYGDLGCMGSQTLETPNLDQLAAAGVLCRHAYVASSVCSPSRAGLMTGRDPRRFGYEGNLNASANSYATRPELLGLPTGEQTLADQLKSAGYATALIGKWHLGTGEAFHPNQRGFDHFCGMLGGSHSYFPLNGRNSIERNGTPVTEFSSEYITDFFTDEGLRFIDWQSEQQPKQPWFVFFSYNAPHTPMQALPNDLERFSHITDKKRRTYAAMVYALDRNVGRIRQSLEDSGQWDNTLLVFFSDNGGATSNASWNGPLRGAKGTMREGGIRIPMIWTWPKQFQAGQVCKSVISSLDLMPTFMSAAGSQPLPLNDPPSHQDARNRKRMVELAGPYDGIDVLPQLTDVSLDSQRRLHWRLQGQAAILFGKHKLVRLSHRPAELFDVGKDIAEANNKRQTHHAEFEEMFEALGTWESTLPTVPLWGSSPVWSGVSAEHYDSLNPRPEPSSPQ
ncbi:Arylsulfatase [Stieleria bergensis]|uniref:Arylsulfatase n=2 Tax=Stieleria bergensis TaxID=2528025 RepID=A0A517SQD9_9BACT|nr:Arylsulfatase [Planctomycetes bacterium SV_7m_r]